MKESGRMILKKKKSGKGREEEKPAPKGYVPVIVGAGEKKEKFMVHVELFKHPTMVVLLENAAEEFGYDHQRGVLRVPCNVQHFTQMLHLISSSSS
ncbi:auxin-responsive protein SAUR71-like [Dioscorea cayenensis subsp. rotundata]|uniref:Auxin-responsive protein SAUR71-like n=1 Tax=Dioscorea cayennensis subsp. rotundata TaxID=55577 RepID=A0AB40BWD3_DIOCR|nr:auxin-responsive protein SAUR71-like [Dioscorea cayenensis subsp. rotundata]